jgi:hypothetical protein
VSHARSNQINFSAKITDAVTLGGNIQITDTATTGQVNTNTYQQTIQRTDGVTWQFSPETAHGVRLETWPVHYTAPFHTTATVDADLSANDKNYQHLSDIIPERARTFSISGTIGFVDAADGVAEDFDLPFIAKTCPPGAGIVEIPPTELQQLEKPL